MHVARLITVLIMITTFSFCSCDNLNESEQFSEVDNNEVSASEIVDIDLTQDKSDSQDNEEIINQILAEADQQKKDILSSPTDITHSGTAYYVSINGDDKNDGLSPETPWATVSKINKFKFKSGDAVFFERGDLWRGIQLQCQNGVTYSAYGQGNKPEFIISPENGAVPENWSLLEDSGNIWVYYRDMEDCGNIILNDGEFSCTKKLPYYTGSKFVLRFDHSKDFIVTEELDTNLSFFSPADSNLPSENKMPFYQFKNGYTEGPVYLRCDSGNPGAVFDSIEFLTPTWGVNVTDNCTLDNLCFKYSGGCGLGGTSDGCTVQNCEFAWIGGCIGSYLPDDTYEGGTIPAGDAVKFDGSNNLCINCYIHDIFEYGLTLEAGYLDTFEVNNQENVTFKDNVLERCGGGSILIFNWEEEPNSNHLFINISVEGNYALYNGYCDWDREMYMSAALCFFEYPNANEGIYITNNVFYLSKNGQLVYSQIPEEYAPIYSGNIYIYDEDLVYSD